MLTLRVRDDGVGLPPNWQIEKNAGIGIRNVASRLEHLYGRTDLLHVDRVPSGGVEVRIDVPINDAEAQETPSFAKVDA